MTLPYCNKCKKYGWPLSYNCKICFEETVFKKIKKQGVLLGKTYSNLKDQKTLFGIGEFSKVRFLGTLDHELDSGERIIISRINIKNNKLDIHFSRMIK